MAPTATLLHSLVLILVMLISLNFVNGVREYSTDQTSEKTGAAREYWSREFSGITMPAVILQSPLSPLSTSAAKWYIRSYNEHRFVGPSLCKEGNLYCNAVEFARVEENSRSCVGVMLASFKTISSERNKFHGGHFFREKDLVRGNREGGGADQIRSVEVVRELLLPALINRPVWLPSNLPPCTPNPQRAFLPRALADALPLLSSDALPQMMELLEIPLKSMLASKMVEMVSICNPTKESLLKGEDAACATSFEAMVDLVKNKFMVGVEDVELLPVSLPSKEPVELVDLKLRAKEGVQYVACHNVMYPSSIYYCHHLPNTRVWAATFKTQDGALLDAVATCHLDTGEWNPMHVAFQDLHAMPGHTDACHWNHRQAMVFVPKKI